MSRRRLTSRPRQRGAALLLAMMILTLVATFAGGMIWQQWRAIEVETAERARTQSAWILNGALDWARLILAEDKGASDNLGEPWAVPLAEARLSTFLAADQNVTEEGGVEAFLSGSIEDAQSRYNLRDLVVDDKVVAEQLQILLRLCEQAGLSQDVGTRIASGLRDAWAPTGSIESAPLAPPGVSELTWLGIDGDSIERLRPWITLLPFATKVNVNTASAEVLAATISGIDLGTAQRLVEARRRTPFSRLQDVQQYLPQSVKMTDVQKVADVKSNFFVVRGRLRLGDHLLEERSLVQRRSPRQVVAVRRERVNLLAGER